MSTLLRCGWSAVAGRMLPIDDEDTEAWRVSHEAIFPAVELWQEVIELRTGRVRRPQGAACGSEMACHEPVAKQISAYSAQP